MRQTRVGHVEREGSIVYWLCLHAHSVSVMDSVYEQLKEDVLSFKQKGREVLLGDFNARVGKSVDVDDVIGMFGEDFCNGMGHFVAE